MDAFQAVADPTRRSIVAMLARGERSAGDIGGHFSMSASAVSQHLKALREAGLVRVRVEGQRRIYRLDPEGLGEVRAWLDAITGYWGGRLDALDALFHDPGKE